MQLTKIILCLGVLLLTTFSVQAQDSTSPEEAVINQKALNVIGVEDYAHFLTIDGLKNYSNINYDGLEFTPNELTGYTLKSIGNSMTLKATYGKDGNLIRGVLIRKNARLPRVIRLYLVNEDYRGWTITSHKTFVHDFDMLKTQYEVKIQNDQQKQTLYFDHSGNQIKKLARL